MGPVVIQQPVSFVRGAPAQVSTALPPIVELDENELESNDAVAGSVNRDAVNPASDSTHNPSKRPAERSAEGEVKQGKRKRKPKQSNAKQSDAAPFANMT